MPFFGAKEGENSRLLEVFPNALSGENIVLGNDVFPRAVFDKIGKIVCEIT